MQYIMYCLRLIQLVLLLFIQLEVKNYCQLLKNMLLRINFFSKICFISKCKHSRICSIDTVIYKFHNKTCGLVNHLRFVNML